MDSFRLPEVIDIGPGAAKRLAAFCAARGGGHGDASGPSRLRLVADGSTWTAMGAEAERELRAPPFSMGPASPRTRGASCASSSTTTRARGSMWRWAPAR
jgi:hypothetical protein